jgi:hypothetical protein
VSVAAPPPAEHPGAAADPALTGGFAVAESCPLCGTPLRPEQQWCLGCGAAARTRLAATPRWRGPLIALGLVIVLALAVLVVALVSLAGQ